MSPKGRIAPYNERRVNLGIILSYEDRRRHYLYLKGKQLVLAAPQLYIDVDIEADGWAGHGSMLSLGAVGPEGQGFYSEIRPITDEFVPHQREFCETHGLQRERLLEEARHYVAVMLSFQRWVRNLENYYGKPPVFTAYNAAFDFGFVQMYFLKAGLRNPFGSATFDLKSLALALDSQWNWDGTSKSQLPPVVLPDGDFTHHALEDAEYQQKLHFGMAGALEEVLRAADCLSLGYGEWVNPTLRESVAK